MQSKQIIFCIHSAEKPDGTFLVRESLTYADTLVLCVVHNGVMKEPIIDRNPLPVKELLYAFGNLILDAAVDMKLEFEYELICEDYQYKSLDQLVSAYLNKAPIIFCGTISTTVALRVRVVCLHVYYTTAQSNFKRVGSRIEWSSTRKSNFSRFVI